jgi:hypothetical protein
MSRLSSSSGDKGLGFLGGGPDGLDVGFTTMLGISGVLGFTTAGLSLLGWGLTGLLLGWVGGSSGLVGLTLTYPLLAGVVGVLVESPPLVIGSTHLLSREILVKSRNTFFSPEESVTCTWMGVVRVILN